MARASILRTGHQTLLLQLHRIHYYASFTRYSSARYNCSIVSRIAKLPRIKRTYTPIKDRKGGRESQEPLKPVDHAIVLRTFRIKRLYGLNGTRWRNQSSAGIARRAAIVIVNALIASLPKNSPPLFALDVLPEGTNVLFGREQFEEISGMMNKKKKRKEKYKNFRCNDEIDLKVKEKLEKQLVEQQLVTNELSSIVAGEMFTEDCRTFIFGTLTTYWRWKHM